ncbi:MAG TPA: PorT family protein [Firmicutes bacterium]|nr:PorT family protein [Bacillota bacterium]
MEGGPKLDKKMRLSFVFGGMMHMPMGDNIVLIGEAAYMQKGVKYQGDGTYEGIDYDAEYIMKMSYLEIDALFKYLATESLGLYGGLGFGLLLSAENEYDFTIDFSPPVNESGSIDIKDQCKSTEISLNFGAQFLATENILLDARYNLGLTNIFDEEYDPDEIKSRTMSLTVGYLF